MMYQTTHAENNIQGRLWRIHKANFDRENSTNFGIVRIKTGLRGSQTKRPPSSSKVSTTNNLAI